MLTRRMHTLMRNKMKRIHIMRYPYLLAFIFCLFFVSTTMASDIAQEMSLEDLLNLKVTVASKTEQSIGDAPSSVTVITREEMLNLGMTCVEDVLNYIPGFVVYRDTNSSRKQHISVRGGRFYDVLFLYNGQRLNGSYQSGYSNATQFIPVENIKQIEIIRGPGSALYGSNAFLGVVNIVTVDDVNNVYVAAGNMERKEAAINLSKSVDDDMTIAGFVKGFSDIGFKYGKEMDTWGIEDRSRDPQKGFSASLTLKYKKFTFDVRHTETQIQDFIMFDAFGDGINESQLAQSHVNMKYSHIFTDRFDMDVSVGYLYDRWDSFFTQVPAGYYPVEFDNTGAPTAFSDNQLAGGPYLTSTNGTANVDGRYKLTDTNSLIFGLSLEYYKNIECSNQGFWNYGGGADFEYFGTLNPDVQGKEFNLEEDRKVVGIYIQDQQEIGDSLSLTVGMRYDDYSDFGNSFNPRAAIVYTSPIQSKVKLMYGEAFRAPNFSELYDKNNPSFAGNPDLDAEKVRTFEAAYIQNLDLLQGTLTFFHSKVSDRIDLGDERLVEGDETSPKIYDNLDDRTTKGLELELKIVPVKQLMIGATYLHFIDPEKDVLSVPANSGSINANCHIGRYNWNVSGLYRESHKLIPSQDDYWIINTALSVSLTDNMRLKGVIHNLFDEDYYTYSKYLTNDFAIVPRDNEGIINRGRIFTIGIECAL